MNILRFVRSRTHRSLSCRLGTESLVILVLAVIGVLAVLLLGHPLLSLSQRRAYNADRVLLQRAVDVYRSNKPSALRPWPSLSGQAGEPREGNVPGFQCDGSDGAEVCSWIDIGSLASQGYLSAPNIIDSANPTLNVGATNAPSGSYGWYVNKEGQVASAPPYTSETGYP